MSDSAWPHKWQSTRFPRPWDSPGKNTGVGCHFLLQFMKVKSESEVAQSCPTLCNPMDCSLPGPSIHGIFQARVLEWGATAFSILKLALCKLKLENHWSLKRLTIITTTCNTFYWHLPPTEQWFSTNWLWNRGIRTKTQVFWKVLWDTVIYREG